MRSDIPLNVQTLYADLAQKLIDAPVERPGSISQRGDYLYAVRREAGKHRQTFLGRADDPDVIRRAEDISRETQRAKDRRTTVSILKRAGMTGPAPHVGRILDAVSDSGLFDRGLVLVGTVAFQCYPALLGRRLPQQSLLTQDADLVAATTSVAMFAESPVRLDAEDQAQPFLALLQRIDPSFQGAPHLDRKAPPSRFLSSSGFDIELLTPVRSRNDKNPVRLPALGAGAIPLQFLEYLIEDAIPAVLLHGSGVRVKIPMPSRYAVHKLIVAQRRDIASVKKPKDLEQARALIAVLDETDPEQLDDAFEDAFSRGDKWRRAIEKSLSELGIDRS